MAPIKFSFSNLELLQLLHEHLVLSGLFRSADVLQEETGLEPLVDREEQQQTVYPVRSIISFQPSHLSRRRSRPDQEEEEWRVELSLTSLVSSKLTEQFSSNPVRSIRLTRPSPRPLSGTFSFLTSVRQR